VKRVKQRVIRDLVLFKNKIKRSLVKQASPSVVKKFFVSSRVAQSHPEFPESAMISEYRTVWPKKSFRCDNSQVKTSYDMRFTFLSQAVSRVALFGLTSLIQVPEPIRELSLRLFVTGGLGYVILLFHRLSKVSPYLLILPIVVIPLTIYTLLLNGNARLELSKIHPIEEESFPDTEENDEGDGEGNENEKKDDEADVNGEKEAHLETNDESADHYQTVHDTDMVGIRLADRMVNQFEDANHVNLNGSSSSSSSSGGSSSAGVTIVKVRRGKFVEDSIWEDISHGQDFFDDFDSYYLADLSLNSS
jgi:hypothetical protein